MTLEEIKQAKVLQYYRPINAKTFFSTKMYRRGWNEAIREFRQLLELEELEDWEKG